MVVEAKFKGCDPSGRLRDGAYELPEGATVAMLIESAQRESGGEYSKEWLDDVKFLVDNRPAVIGTVLADGSVLRVIYTILGG